MKKLRRVQLTAVGVLLGLSVLVMVGLSLFLPVDKLADRLEAEVEKATGTELEIGGAGLSWWPRLGVSLKDVAFSGDGARLARAMGTENDLGPFQGLAAKLQIRISPILLLKRQTKVDAAVLENLELDLEKNGLPMSLTGARVDIFDLEMDLESWSEAAEMDGAPIGEKIPESLVLGFRGEAGSFNQDGLLMKDIRFHGGLDTRLVTVPEMVARVGDGRLEGHMEIDYERDPRGIMDFEARAEAVPAAELLAPWAPVLAQRLDTDLNAEVRGTLVLGNRHTVTNSLVMNGGFESGEGVLRAADWLGEVRPYLGSRQDLVNVRFSGLDHGLRVENGRYVVENLTIQGLDTDWEGSGSIGLDGSLDLDVTVLLPAGFTPKLGQWSFLADALRDENGRVKLDLRVGGNGSKPQVAMNFGSLGQAGQPGGGEALKKGLGGLLDKLRSR